MSRRSGDVSGGEGEILRGERNRNKRSQNAIIFLLFNNGMEQS